MNIDNSFPVDDKNFLIKFFMYPAKTNKYILCFFKFNKIKFSKFRFFVSITKYGIELILQNLYQSIFLLHTTNFILIGKLYSLDLFIRFFKFEPVPDIKHKRFFLPF